MADAALTVVSIVLGMFGIAFIASGFRAGSRLVPALIIGGCVLAAGVYLMPDHSTPDLIDVNQPYRK